MSAIPRKCKLSEIADVLRGISFGSSEGQDRPLENHLPVLRAGNIQDRLLVETDLVWVPKSRVNLNQLIKKHDIIMCTSSGSALLVGKCARAESDWQGSFGAFCVGIRPIKDKCDPSYLHHFLRSSAFTNWSNLSSGANIKNIRKSELEEFEIPLPPLDEQRRIAAILDKADAIRRKRQESIRLTEEFLRSTFSDMFGDIPAKKSKYDFGTIRGLVSAQSGKSSNQVISQEKTAIPIYGGNGINGWATTSLFEEKVVVVGRVGQQCGIVHITEGPAWVTDNAIVIKVTDAKKLHPIYVAEALQKSLLRSTVEQLDLPFINQSTILDYPIPIPPLDKQLEFVKVRENVLNTRLKLTSSNVFTNQMFNSLTHRAFRGEL